MRAEVRQALSEVRSEVSVTNQKVTYAKSYVLKNFASDTEGLLRELLEDVDARMPNELVIHPSANTPGMTKKAAESISWTLAFCEAIWGLISSNLIIPAGSGVRWPIQSLNWTTVVPGGGGESSTENLTDLSLPVPSQILTPRSISCQEHQPLTDPDLYLHDIDIENLSSEVEEALREAVQCFKHDLYLACLALLGKASEGAWIELGLALCDRLPEDGEKRASSFRDPFIGIGKKIVEALKLYEQREIFEDVYKQSGYKPKELRNAVIWADAVRESRNSVHYGAKPAMPNSYEKVSALMIGALPHLKMVYSIIESAAKGRKRSKVKRHK